MTAKNTVGRGCVPGGLVVKNPPPRAEDVGSAPGRGTRIPHAMGQLNPHTAARVQTPQQEKPVQWNKEPTPRRKTQHSQNLEKQNL